MKKSEREELKRLAEAALSNPVMQAPDFWFSMKANPAAIQSLLAELDRLEAQRDWLLGVLKRIDDLDNGASTIIGFAANAFKLLPTIRAAITEAELQS